MSLGFRPLIEPTNQWFVANGKSWPLPQTPTGDTYSLLGIALAVAHLLTAQAPTVRSKVADTGTSPDISGLP